MVDYRATIKNQDVKIFTGTICSCFMRSEAVRRNIQRPHGGRWLSWDPPLVMFCQAAGVEKQHFLFLRCGVQCGLKAAASSGRKAS